MTTQLANSCMDSGIRERKEIGQVEEYSSLDIDSDSGVGTVAGTTVDLESTWTDDDASPSDELFGDNFAEREGDEAAPAGSPEKNEGRKSGKQGDAMDAVEQENPCGCALGEDGGNVGRSEESDEDDEDSPDGDPLDGGKHLAECLEVCSWI